MTITPKSCRHNYNQPKTRDEELTRNAVVNISTRFTLGNPIEELPIPNPTPLNLPPLLQILKIPKMLLSQSTLFSHSNDPILLERSAPGDDLLHRLPRPIRRRDVEKNLPRLPFRHDLLYHPPRCPSLLGPLLDQLDLVVGDVLEDAFVLVHLTLSVTHQYDAPREVVNHLFLVARHFSLKFVCGVLVFFEVGFVSLW